MDKKERDSVYCYPEDKSRVNVIRARKGITQPELIRAWCEMEEGANTPSEITPERKL